MSNQSHLKYNIIGESVFLSSENSLEGLMPVFDLNRKPYIRVKKTPDLCSIFYVTGDFESSAYRNYSGKRLLRVIDPNGQEWVAPASAFTSLKPSAFPSPRH